MTSPCPGAAQTIQSAPSALDEAGGRHSCLHRTWTTSLRLGAASSRESDHSVGHRSARTRCRRVRRSSTSGHGLCPGGLGAGASTGA
eukprot:scaffold84279_cov84-Phaeocystis_antarctica.AAC.1